MNYNKEEYKSILLRTVAELDRVCCENGLRYFLTGGSMIGAVRHHGMIPWDDDIDVAMPRRDLEKLKEIAPKVFDADYELVDYHTPDYHFRFAKLYYKNSTVVEDEYNFYVGGVWVDVFALDGLPGDREEACHYYNNYYAPNWYRLYCLYFPCGIVLNKGLKGFLRSIRTCVRHLLYDKQKLIEKLERVASEYDFDSAEWIINFQGGYGLKELSRREYFDGYVLMDFDGYQLRVPKGYDGYLRDIYGDYMTLPPIEKRNTNHTFFFVDLKKRQVKEEIFKRIYP